MITLKFQTDLGSFAKHYDSHNARERYDATGDAMLFNGLLISVGQEDFVPAVIRSFDHEGRAFRSPRRLLERNNANEFSRDMAVGLILGAASHPSLERLLRGWVKFTLRNGFKSCNNATDSRGWVTPAIYTLASYVVPDSVPIYFKLLNWTLPISMWFSARSAPIGYPLHLVAVQCLIREKVGKWQWVTRLIGKQLVKRDQNNPLFQYLAGNTKQADLLSRVYFKDATIMAHTSTGHQWAWERDSKEMAWLNSCGWDFLFMQRLLAQGSQKTADK